MNFLEEKIRTDGIVLNEKVLKVDTFLDHQIDVSILNKIADYFKEKWSDLNFDKVLTIEASGIAIATVVAQKFNVPLVFAKKSKTLNISDDVYTADVMSFTHQKMNKVIVSKEVLNKDENILIIDDFLAHGEALTGLISICKQAGANVSAIGIAIEKAFQKGGEKLREQGYKIESIARINKMDATSREIEFIQ